MRLIFLQTMDFVSYYVKINELHYPSQMCGIEAS